MKLRIKSGVFLIIVLVTFASAEIHRAKSLKAKISSGRSVNRDHGIKRLFNGTDVLFWGHTTETWVLSVASAALVGLSGIFPLLVIPLEAGKALRKGAGAARLQLLLSFAVGGLLGDVFLHLLPEAWNHVNTVGHDHSGHTNIGLWVIAGILIFLIIEKIFPDHDDDDNDVKEGMTDQVEKSTTEMIANSLHEMSNGTSPKKRKGKTTQNNNSKTNSHMNGHSNGHLPNGVCSKISNGVQQGASGAKETIKQYTQHIKTSGWLNLLANIIDNFTHGLAVAGSYCVSTRTGILTTIAVLLHEIPHEVGDFAILLRAGFDRWKAAKAQMLTASGGLVGAIVALCAESAKAAGDRTAWVLPFTSGGFIYIAMVTVVPDLMKENNPRTSMLQVLLLLSGIAVMALVTIMFDA